MGGGGDFSLNLDFFLVSLLFEASSTANESLVVDKLLKIRISFYI